MNPPGGNSERTEENEEERQRGKKGERLSFYCNKINPLLLLTNIKQGGAFWLGPQ